jgi:thiol:disulfide interchange protein DsbD
LAPFFLFRSSRINKKQNSRRRPFILTLTQIKTYTNMLIRLSFLLTFALTTLFSSAQDEMPSSIDEVINWKFSVTYEGCEAVINMTVLQKNGWHVYAQKQPEGAVSYPTSFTFEPSDAYDLIGNTKEYGTETHTNGGIPEKMFPGDKAKFKQRIKINSKQDFKIKISYEFMACKEACFPPDFREIEIKVKGKTEDCNASGETEEIEESDEDPESLGTDPTSLDSSLAVLASTCEGFTYVEAFDPVKINVSDAVRDDKKEFTVSVAIEIDSIFAMYAFNNPDGYESIFNLHESDSYELSGDRNTSFQKTVGEDTSGYKYRVVISQQVSVKDTLSLPVVTGDLDLFLMGCENDFHNIEKTELSFDLNAALDTGIRTEKDSLWLIFILAFLGGFIALLTPCVFPMIPMTVTFFTKQSKTKSEGIRKAIFYAVCIIVIYVILGVLVSSLAGPTALNEMATNPIVNIIFFALFVVFAVSFLGAFEIKLPSSWVNKADKQADKGGMIGIFFMAFTLALVSFSCTGPIVGTVLVQSAQGGLSGPIVAMLGFSLALALPFGLFAAFPGWLNSMPQSGGWLNVVKVVLGFLELAFALKFLSNADLVEQWHLLERETFLAIWIGIFVVLAIYLLGRIKLPHDSPVDGLSVGRTIFATIVISFIIYLIPGMFGAPLKMIAGFPPPSTYSESPYGIHGEAPEIEDGWPESTYAHGHGINTIRDYYDALAYAKEVDKPLLLDFTGWACVNCRKMEEQVWADESIAPMMADDFVVASLYVDDREELPADEAGAPMVNGRTMKTIGDKWMDLQIRKYQEVTQPMYVVLDHNENNISGKANYQTHGEVDLFRQWLEFSKEQFKSSKNTTTIIPEFEIIGGEEIKSDIELR